MQPQANDGYTNTVIEPCGVFGICQSGGAFCLQASRQDQSPCGSTWEYPWTASRCSSIRQSLGISTGSAEGRCKLSFRRCANELHTTRLISWSQSTNMYFKRLFPAGLHASQSSVPYFNHRLYHEPWKASYCPARPQLACRGPHASQRNHQQSGSRSQPTSCSSLQVAPIAP